MMAAWLAQVAPLTVTLAAAAPCPAPAVEAPLVELPTGCPAPWDGVLATLAEHTRSRQQWAEMESVLGVRRRFGEAASAALAECRTQRDDVLSQCARDLARIEGVLMAVPPPPEPVSALPWVALAGGLGAAGAAGARALGASVWQTGAAGLAGAALGVAVAWMVEAGR